MAEEWLLAQSIAQTYSLLLSIEIEHLQENVAPIYLIYDYYIRTKVRKFCLNVNDLVLV